MKPVSRMISRISVKGTRGNEFQRLEPSAQRTFLLTGRRLAAWASEPARRVIAVRRVIGEVKLVEIKTFRITASHYDLVSLKSHSSPGRDGRIQEDSS